MRRERLSYSHIKWVIENDYKRLECFVFILHMLVWLIRINKDINNNHDDDDDNKN